MRDILFKGHHPLFWIRDQDIYRYFLSTLERGILHLCGNPGSGLSLLASFVSISLQDDLPNATSLRFSFDCGDYRQCSTYSLFASLIRQMLSSNPSCFTHVCQLYNLIREKASSKRSSWPLEDLWVFFRSMLLCPDNGPIIIIIDTGTKRDTLYDHFLTNLLSLTQSADLMLKIIITNCEEAVTDPTSLTLKVDTLKEWRTSVDSFVDRKLQSLVQSNRSLIGFRETLRQAILTSKPNFLEAGLLCKLLENTPSRSTPLEVRTFLKYLPTSLPDIYNRCFLENLVDRPRWVRDTLYWITHAYRPLRLDELAVALAIKYDTEGICVMEDEIPSDLARDLIRAFGGFVRIQNNQVRLFHESAKEYLCEVLKDWEPKGKDSAFWPSHFRIAECCLDYLLTIEWADVMSDVDEIDDKISPEGTSGLLFYAAEYWHVHYRGFSATCPPNDLLKKAIKIINKDEWIRVWSHLQRYEFSVASENNNPLLLAAGLGLNDIVNYMLQTHQCSDEDHSRVLDLAAARGDTKFISQLLEKGFESENALSSASRKGHSEIVSQLLDKYAGVGTTDETGSTALHIACQSGHDHIVNSLISRGSDIDASDASQYTPLHLASEYGHITVMKTLLHKGAYAWPKAREGSTPLHLATRYVQLKAMALLLDSDTHAHVDDIDLVGKAAIHIAASSGLKNSLALLLDRHARIDIADDKGNTALHLAVEVGHLHSAQLLLKAGADHTAVNSTGETPLHLAAATGIRDVVSYLLGKKASVVEENSKRRTPLHLAAFNGHTKVAEQLIEVQSKIIAGKNQETEEWSTRKCLDKMDMDDATPLHLAAASGHQGVIKLLIKAGASLNISDKNGFTPLAYAVREGKIEIVRILVDAKADADFWGTSHPPLHVASEQGGVEIMSFLLENGANPYTTDVSGNTPLHLAARAGNRDAIQVLLDAGVDCDWPNGDSATPLLLAAEKGHFDIMAMLCEAGAMPTVCDESDSTPLHKAAMNGHLEAVNLLIEKEGDVLANDYRSQVPLHLAAQNGKAEIVERLLNQKKRSAQVKAINEEEETALHLASRNKHKKVLSILLDAGAELNAVSKNGTALSWALSNGDSESARLLLEKGANVTVGKRGQTGMHLVANCCELEMTKLVFEKGGKIYLDTLDDEGNPPLHSAICAQDLASAKYLLDRGASANVPESFSAIYTAAFRGEVEMVQEFLKRGIDYRARDSQDWTALHAAYDSPEIVRLLLAAGADVNSVDSKGLTTLHMAAHMEEVETVRLLVENNANLSMADEKGNTALHEAVDDPEIVQLLLNKEVQLELENNEGETPLHVAIRRRQTESAEKLLQKGAYPFKPDMNGSTVLHDACRWGWLGIVQLVISKADRRLDIKDRKGRTPLWLAVKNCRIGVVQELLKDPEFAIQKHSKKDKTLLLLAAEREGSVGGEIMQLLLPTVKDITNSGAGALLIYGCIRGNVPLVKMLLGFEISTDVTDEHGWPLALLARTIEHIEILQLLPRTGRHLTAQGSELRLPNRLNPRDKSGNIIVEEDCMSARTAVNTYSKFLHFQTITESTNFLVLTLNSQLDSGKSPFISAKGYLLL